MKAHERLREFLDISQKEEDQIMQLVQSLLHESHYPHEIVEYVLNEFDINSLETRRAAYIGYICCLNISKIPYTREKEQEIMNDIFQRLCSKFPDTPKDLIKKELEEEWVNFWQSIQKKRDESDYV